MHIQGGSFLLAKFGGSVMRGSEIQIRTNGHNAMRIPVLALALEEVNGVKNNTVGITIYQRITEVL